MHFSELVVQEYTFCSINCLGQICKHASLRFLPQCCYCTATPYAERRVHLYYVFFCIYWVYFSLLCAPETVLVGLNWYSSFDFTLIFNWLLIGNGLWALKVRLLFECLYYEKSGVLQCICPFGGHWAYADKKNSEKNWVQRDIWEGAVFFVVYFLTSEVVPLAAASQNTVKI